MTIKQIGKNCITAKNTVISPDFLVQKFCGKEQFPHSFAWFARNYAETVPFHKFSTPGNFMKIFISLSTKPTLTWWWGSQIRSFAKKRRQECFVWGAGAARFHWKKTDFLLLQLIKTWVNVKEFRLE